LKRAILHKIMMYSHDTFGLGHIRRTLAIARRLRKSPANILILTGSPLVGRFSIPQRVDFVRFPGMIKVTNEDYLPHSMKLDPTEVLELRKQLILTTAKAFQPDFFIVDKAPLGLKREVVDTLKWLNESAPSCKTILGLRDIMDSAESTIEDWASKGIYEAMQQLYDEVWVYGHKDFYDPIREYAMPSEVACKVHFTGYIPRHIPKPSEQKSIRRKVGIAQHERLILLTTGGGSDGYPVINCFLKAFEDQAPPPNVRAMIVTGPFIAKRHLKEIRKRCEALHFVSQKFHDSMEDLIGASDAIVSMGGYNTVCEIISQKKPFLIVPRTVPREEQLIRAQVLSDKGFCDYLHPEELSPEAMRDKVLALLANGSTYRWKADLFPFTALQVICNRIQFRKEAPVP
jgi:predicted glycosyltransferase